MAYAVLVQSTIAAGGITGIDTAAARAMPGVLDVMTADNAVRVERRFRELYEKNPNVSIEEVKNNLEMRDYIDSHREISPLRKAEDAIVLDNSNLTTQEQYQLAMKWALEKIKPKA